MSPLKEVAPENMDPMSVTDETVQEEMSPLKEVAPENMDPMSVTDETVQEEMSPLKEVAPENMPLMLATEDRSGLSVALYSMLEAPLNADSIVVHPMLPQ